LKQIKAVVIQNQKLTELADYFCKKISRTLMSIFDSVTKHKSLHKDDRNNFTGMEVKKMSFSFVVDHGLKFSSKQLHSTGHNAGD
jgi:uncharacterized FAD-dependent dehydrogenase